MYQKLQSRNSDIRISQIIRHFRISTFPKIVPLSENSLFLQDTKISPLFLPFSVTFPLFLSLQPADR